MTAERELLEIVQTGARFGFAGLFAWGAAVLLAKDQWIAPWRNRATMRLLYGPKMRPGEGLAMIAPASTWDEVDEVIETWPVADRAFGWWMAYRLNCPWCTSIPIIFAAVSVAMWNPGFGGGVLGVTARAVCATVAVYGAFRTFA